MSKIANGFLVAMLLSASVVVEADSKYPATDFQPKVVYQDSDYKHSGASASSSKVVKGEVSVADPSYPAANFQPEVLYSDDGYKHKKDSVRTSSSTSTASVSASSSVAEESQEASVSDDSSMSLVIGLAVLACAGFLFYSKNAKKSPSSKKRVVRKRAAVAAKTDVASNDGSTSGVAKYLESKVGEKPSGVAKYLDDRDSSPVSGVAKYVAKKKVSARLASVTGVEKYLKDRG